MSDNDRELEALIIGSGMLAALFYGQVLQYLQHGCKATDEEVESLRNMQSMASELLDAAQRTMEQN